MKYPLEPMTEDPETLNVKLMAGFLGLKFLPRAIVIALNNFNPKLILSDKGIEYRAFVFTGRLTYDEIEHVDILLWNQTAGVSFIRKNSIVTISAITNNEEELYDCLRYLRRHGCAMTKRAEAYFQRHLDMIGK